MRGVAQGLEREGLGGKSSDLKKAVGGSEKAPAEDALSRCRDVILHMTLLGVGSVIMSNSHHPLELALLKGTSS